jgi:hypothetical protein
MTTRFMVVSFAMFFLGTCQSMSDPVSMGKDTYMISASARGGFSSNGELLAQTVQKAGEFCQAQGLKVQVMNTQATGVRGWTPQDNQVVFRCLADDDAGYTRPVYRPAPQIVIENQNQ